MNKIRTGDEVIVLTGRDKGKRGKVLARKDDSHLLVEGINLVKKHTNCTSAICLTRFAIAIWSNPSASSAP